MLTPGTLVDRYVIQHLLGRGGMASVYAVKHQVLGTRHALKVLHTAAPGVRDRLVREGRLQARLDPRHVVPVTDVFDVDGSPALLMPLVEGCSLAELLEDHRLSEAEVAALFAGVVAGVASAHAAGVIHRDLKPANVLLEVKRGVVVVRVADFGLARPEAEDYGQTVTGLFIGTPAYAAPEQLVDSASVDHRADLWSLGVMLFELLTGVRPFQATSLVALMGTVTAGRFDRDAVPERWRAVVDGLLQVDLGQRTASAEALAEALAATAGGEALAIGGPVAEVVRWRVDAAQAAARAIAVVQDTVDQAATAMSPTATRHNLPTERDPFVGRAADLATLHARLVGRAHLVSVLGIGGAGKTRLVLHYGWRHLADWPGGVWFCDLSEARTVDGIVAAVAVALDVPLGKGDAVAQLGHAIAGRGRCLVILDNYEQVAQYARETLGSWLDRASDAAFVVTTREVLGLAGEVPLALAPLEPEDSAELFVARAEVAKQGFVATSDDTSAIEELVALLDHLPLAIELAAARIRVLPPRKLLARMTDRFRVLTSAGGRRDRQATLRATLDWSWDLLADWEQAALAQVSVFEGGFDLEATEAVLDLSDFDDAPWAMDAVQALVDKSLVRPVGDDRFDLLVSVHVYAMEKLQDRGPVEATQARHGAWFAGFGTEAALQALDVHGGVARRQALALEVHNVVAACQRAVGRGDGETAAATCRAAWAILSLRGPFAVGATLAGSVLAMPGLSAADRGTVSRCAGGAHDALGRVDEARTHYEAALALARAVGDPRGEREVLSDLAVLHRNQGRMDEARSHHDAALALARELGDRGAEGDVLGKLGTLCMVQGRLDEARAHFDAALAADREVGNRRGEGVVLGSLGVLDKDQGRADEARAHFDAALAVARECSDRRNEATVLSNLAIFHAGQGRMNEALALLRASVTANRKLGDRRREGIVLGNLGHLYRIEGDIAAARVHLSEALAIHREVDFDYGQPYWLADLALLDAEKGRLDAALERALEAVEVAAAYPLVQAEVLQVLARVHLARVDTRPAREAITRARALGQAGDVGALVAAADALVAVTEGDVAAAEAALAETMADPAHRQPGTELGQLLAQARAGLQRLVEGRAV